MAFEYRIDPLRGIVFATGRGSLTAAEIESVLRRIRRDDQFRSDLPALIDLSGVANLDVSAAEVRDVARNDPFGPGSRRAIVAPTDAVYGVARMYQMLRDDVGEEIEIFRTTPEARHWLGLEDGT